MLLTCIGIPVQFSLHFLLVFEFLDLFGFCPFKAYTLPLAGGATLPWVLFALVFLVISVLFISKWSEDRKEVEL